MTDDVNATDAIDNSLAAPLADAMAPASHTPATDTPATEGRQPGSGRRRGGRGGRGGGRPPAQADGNADGGADAGANAHPGARGHNHSGNPSGQAGQRPQRQVHPMLEQLAGLYPKLFGAEFLPLKRGIFQDLRAAHPEVFAADGLKEALGQHTRSTRYLQGIAAARPRHDLAGEVVEALAPEHVYQALVELWRRRANRTPEAGKPALRDELRQRIVRAFEASGLSREAYAEKVRTRDESLNALLDEALAEASARAAKDEALLRAFEAGNASVEAFADMYGMDPRQTGQLLEAARRRRAAAVAAAAAAVDDPETTDAQPDAPGEDAPDVDLPADTRPA